MSRTIEDSQSRRTGPIAPRLESLWNAVLSRLPVFVFVFVYVFTGYLGAFGFIFSDPFRDLYRHFSGAQLPPVTSRELWLALLLLHAGPVILWVGFELCWRALTAPRKAPGEELAPAGLEPAPVVSVVGAAFLASAVVAAWSIARAGGGVNFLSWFDYNDYVYARWRLFDRLTFFEFVNLYTLLPLTAAYLILATRRLKVAACSLVLVFLLQFPLANRKALLTSMTLIAAADYVYFYLGRSPRRRAAARWHFNLFFVAPTALYIAFVALTVLPVISGTSRPFQSKGQAPAPPEPPAQRPPAADIALFAPEAPKVPSVLTGDRRVTLAFYIALSPVTRTSVSAIVYPATFPRLRPYYHVDLGLDILRIGTMPDDNLVVYRLLWPVHHRGSIAAPFHFVLYSQGGVVVAMLGALVIGGVLGACWALVLRRPRPSVEMSLVGALVVVFAVFLAIDSVRNATTVSYGLLWGGGAVLLISGLSRAVGRLRDRPAA